MTVWFTSDQHFGHANIIAHCARPFSSVEEMDEAIVELFCSRVRPGDTTYHLGDFAMNERHVGPFLSRLPGRHVLVCGNHDRCHPCHRQHMKATRAYLAAGFSEVHERTWIELLGRRVLLCHMPILTHSTGADVRYLEWRVRPERLGDDWLLHGHVHEKWKVRGRAVNVGVDQWGFAPVSAETLADLVAEVERGDESNALAGACWG